MMASSPIIPLFVMIITTTVWQVLSLQILCILDKEVSITCEESLKDIPQNMVTNVNQNVSTNSVNGSSVIGELLLAMGKELENTAPDVIVTVGNVLSAHIVAVVANCQGIPQVSLFPEVIPKAVSEKFLSIGPSGKEMAEMFYYFIKAQNISKVTLIHDLDKADDDFALFMKHLLQWRDIEGFKHFGTSLPCEDDASFLRKMIELRDNGSRLIILHAGPEITKQVIKCAVKHDLFEAGHVWILTNTHFTDGQDSNGLPVGLLTLEYTPSKGFSSELQNILTDVITNHAYLTPRNKTGFEQNCMYSSLQYVDNMDFLRAVGRSSSKIKRSFTLRNLVETELGREWRAVGVVGKDHIKLDSIIWPGGSIYGPNIRSRMFLRVATVPAPPFVQVRDPDNRNQECYTDTPCLQLLNTDKVMVYLDSYLRNGPPEDQQYTFHCCSGLSIDLLNQLSNDLDFEFMLYFFPDNVNRIGKLVNGTWDGAIGQVYTGVADIMIGAFSITSSRSTWIDFTVPFYQSGFTMLSMTQKINPEMDAFLQPYSTKVWVTIVAVASTTAVISSFLEWNSPFGLSPRGRDRQHHYTLGSCIVTVFSVVFGHTVPTKSPKSWPCRFVLNVWSVFAIVFIASYTANLAAVLAGKDNDVFYTSPRDSRLNEKIIAVIGETSVASYLSQLYPELYSRMIKTDVRSSKGMIDLMRQNNFDIFIHDLPILEYARARLDGQCTLRLVGRTFGDDGYGIGLPKGSKWKGPMSELILSYGLSGFLEDIERAHFSELSCASNGLSQEDMQYGLAHTGGLFIMLGIAIVLAIVILAIEHVVYRIILPVLRKKPDNSVFKSIHLMYFSQRLYRSTVASEIVPPSHGAREILAQVRNKQFVEIFQKEQRRKYRIPKTRLGKQEFQNEITPQRGQMDVTESVADGLELEISHLDETNGDDMLQNTANGSDLQIDEPSSATTSGLSRQQSLSIAPGNWPNTWPDEWLDNESLEEDIDCYNEKIGIDNTAFVMNNERHENTTTVKRNVSLKESDLCRNSSGIPNIENNIGKFVKSYSCRPSRGIWTVSESNGITEHFKSLTEPGEGVYGEKPSMKDNRTKSRIRRNTMEELCKTFSVDLIDTFTLESLSKSELLLLWKASEINLKRQLADISKQKETLLSMAKGPSHDKHKHHTSPV